MKGRTLGHSHIFKLQITVVVFFFSLKKSINKILFLNLTISFGNQSVSGNAISESYNDFVQ